MDDIFLKYLVEEFFIILLVSIIYKYFKRKSKFTRKFLIILSIILSVDFVNILLLFLNLNLIDLNNSKFYVHYAIQIKEVPDGELINPIVYVKPYFGFFEKPMSDFNFFNKFYTRFILTMLKPTRVSDSLFYSIKKKIPLCFVDSLGSNILISSSSDTVYLSGFIKNNHFLNRAMEAAKEANGFLAKFNYQFKIICRVFENKNILNYEQKSIRIDSLKCQIFSDSAQYNIDNPFLKIWSKVVF